MTNAKPKRPLPYYQRKLIRFTSLCDRMSQEEIESNGRVSEKTRGFYEDIVNFKSAIEMAF